MTAGLLLFAIVGVISAIFSGNSCRFVVVTFVSDRGNFDSIFTSQELEGDGVEKITTAAGLYSWLAPGESWHQGTCTGYTQSALEIISDTMFEVARVLIVIAVLMGIGVFVWILSLSCLSLGPRQVYLLAACQLLLVLLTSLTFLIKQSGLCQDVGQDTSCHVDEGGIIMIASAISWFFGFLITILFMKSPEKERQEREEEIQRRAEALADKKRKKAVLKQKRKEEKEAMKAEIMGQKPARSSYARSPSTPVMSQEMARSSPTGSLSTPLTVGSGGDYEDFEITLARSLDRIENMIDDDGSL